jgi:histidyl-tRNA synthetase
MDKSNKTVKNSMSTEPVKGMRDLLPEDKILLDDVINTIKETFEEYGFDPLETPALESFDMLSAKGAGGPGVLKETYNFEDFSGRKIGLRYEFTVSLARVLTRYPNIPKPFKRYQIGKVWRYGDVAKGRLREFWQADIDTVGSSSMKSDAEIIACSVVIFRKLGFKRFVVRVNNRKLLNSLLKSVGVPSGKYNSVLRIVDKLEKIGRKGVEDELREKGFFKEMIDGLLRTITSKIDFKKLKLEDNTGIEELKDLMRYLKIMKIKEAKIDLSLARGLDYYTGTIFEINAGKEVGSVAGGGRYDEMIGRFSGTDVPAVGISFGPNRIVELLTFKKIVKKSTLVKVFVASTGEDVDDYVVRLTQNLREKGISSDSGLLGRNLTKQIDYANRKGIPFVVIVGPKEMKQKKVTLKNMKSGKEKLITLTELYKSI